MQEECDNVSNGIPANVNRELRGAAMKSRALWFTVVVLLILIFWGLSSTPKSVYETPPFPQPHPLVEYQPATKIGSVVETAEANDEEAAYFRFADLNAVYAIEAVDESIRFIGKNGTRILEPSTGKWRFSTREYDGPDIYDSEYRWDQDTLTEKLPDWYLEFPTCADGHYYDKIWAHCRDGDKEFYLVTNTWGGITGEEDVIDVAGRKIYRMPYQDSRFMVVRNGSAWLGGKRGIVRLDLSTGRRWECVCPPRYWAMAGAAEYGKMRFITSREGDFMILDTETNAIKLKALPAGLVSNVFGAPGKGCNISPYPIWFSNPVSAKGKIYIAAHNYDYMAILLYDIARETWSHVDLPAGLVGDMNLIQSGDTIWCASQYIYGDGEGIETDEFGGVVALVPGKAPKVYPTLVKVPIGGYRLNGDTIQFLSAKAIDDPPYCYPGLMNDRSNQPQELREIDFCCTISLATLQIVGYTALDAVGSPFTFSKVGSPVFTGGDYCESEWLVVPAMMEIPDPHVEILWAGEFGTE